MDYEIKQSADVGSIEAAASAKAQADQLRQKAKDVANLIARKAMNLPENVNVPIIDDLIDAIIACAVLEACAKLVANLPPPMSSAKDRERCNDQTSPMNAM